MGMTNKEKFIEVFGLEPNEHFCPLSEEISCGSCLYSKNGCDEDHKDRFFSMEYKESTTKNDLGVDCISRQTVIDLMMQKWGENFSGDDAMQESIDAIRVMPSVTLQEPKWIPVSEYLPVTNDEVLVTYIVNGNAKKRYVETANCYDGEWSSVNDEYRIPNTKIEIIAWCEMPKPYSEVKE